MLPLTAKLFAELLRDIGHATIEVHGSSMLPVILPGDVLKVQAGQVAIGDIAVFVRNDRICAHRVVEIDGLRIVTRGDANLDPDPWLCRREILGRVTSVRRHGRTVSDLEPHPVSSQLIGNSPLIRRAFLRIHGWRRDLQSIKLAGRFTTGKSEG